VCSGGAQGGAGAGAATNALDRGEKFTAALKAEAAGETYADVCCRMLTYADECSRRRRQLRKQLRTQLAVLAAETNISS
jgi:hypothetical protein